MVSQKTDFLAAAMSNKLALQIVVLLGDHLVSTISFHHDPWQSLRVSQALMPVCFLGTVMGLADPRRRYYEVRVVRLSASTL